MKYFNDSRMTTTAASAQQIGAPVATGGVENTKQTDTADFGSRRISVTKYRRVEKPTSPSPDGEVRVTAQGGARRYINYASKVLGEGGLGTLRISATGRAIGAAITVCEVSKRLHAGLHQETVISWTEIVDEYEPLEPGLERITGKRQIPSITITLTRDETLVNKEAIGYQPPIDPAFVEKEKADNELRAAQPKPPRAAGGGRNRRYNRGRGGGEREDNAAERRDRPQGGRGGRRRPPKNRTGVQEEQPKGPENVQS